MSRDRAGRCSASAPTGDTSARLIIFSDARRATVGSMRGITYGFRITRPRCRTPRKIRCSSSNRCCQGDRERDLVITARRAASRRRKLLFFSICSHGVSPLRHKNVSRFLEHHEGGLAASHQSTIVPTQDFRRHACDLGHSVLSGSNHCPQTGHLTK